VFETDLVFETKTSSTMLLGLDAGTLDAVVLFAGV
jgi:hypothetical protein